MRKLNTYITTLKDLVTCEEPKEMFEGLLGNFIKLDNTNEKIINCANERNIIEPTLIYSKNKINLWYKVIKIQLKILKKFIKFFKYFIYLIQLDRTFWSPKVNFHLNISSENLNKSIDEIFDFHLFHRFIKDMFVIKFADTIDSGNFIDITFNEK